MTTFNYPRQLTDRSVQALEILGGASRGIRAKAFAERVWPDREAWKSPAKSTALIARAGRWLAELARDGYAEAQYDAKGARYYATADGKQALERHYQIPVFLGGEPPRSA